MYRVPNRPAGRPADPPGKGIMAAVAITLAIMAALCVGLGVFSCVNFWGWVGR